MLVAQMATMQQRSYVQASRYIDQLIEELRRVIPLAMKKWDEDAIHDARVCTRRLKAAVDLLIPVTTEQHRKPLGKTLRTLRRTLGPLRDLDVMISHLQEKRYQRGHRRAAAWVVEELQAERRREREKFSAKVSAPRILGQLGGWWGLREEIAGKRRMLTPVLVRSLHEQVNSFAGQADSMVTAGGADAATAGQRVEIAQAEAGDAVEGTGTGAGAGEQVPAAAEAPGTDPHALRIAGKLLRYTLELASATGHELPGPVLKQFKHMQGALGLWHDYVVLSQKVMRLALDDEIACHDRVLYEQLSALAGLLWRQAEHQLKVFAGIWQDQGPQVASSIREAMVLPAAAGAGAAASGAGSAASENQGEATIPATDTPF